MMACGIGTTRTSPDCMQGNNQVLVLTWDATYAHGHDRRQGVINYMMTRRTEDADAFWL